MLLVSLGFGGDDPLDLALPLATTNFGPYGVAFLDRLRILVLDAVSWHVGRVFCLLWDLRCENRFGLLCLNSGVVWGVHQSRRF
jgi:hypothetical protein